MNILLTFFFIVMASLSSLAQLQMEFKLPLTWDKNFTVQMAYHHLLSGSKTNIKFTHDSVRYTSTARSNGSKEKVYLMKEEDRTALLEKLRELKVDQIKDEAGVRYAFKDGWSQSLCFGLYCIEGGSTAIMSDKDKTQFLDACRHLREFAMENAK